MAVIGSDQISLTNVIDGYSVILTNDSYTFIRSPNNSSATLSTQFQIFAYCGNEQVAAVVNKNTITVPSGVTASVDNSTQSSYGLAPNITITINSTFTGTDGEIVIPVTIGDTIVDKKFSFVIIADNSIDLKIIQKNINSVIVLNANLMIGNTEADDTLYNNVHWKFKEVGADDSTFAECYVGKTLQTSSIVGEILDFKTKKYVFMAYYLDPNFNKILDRDTIIIEPREVAGVYSFYGSFTNTPGGPPYDDIKAFISNRFGNKDANLNDEWQHTVPHYQEGYTVYKLILTIYTDGTYKTDKIVEYMRTDEAKAISDYNYQKVLSRGQTNLVTNGNGILGNNYNFPSFEYDGVECYNGSCGSFKISGKRAYTNITEKIPINRNKKYKISLNAKSSVSSTFYMFIDCFDIDGNSIRARDFRHYKGYTTLAQDLNDGDTIVHLTDISVFNKTTSNSYQRGLIFWNYKNSYGFQYPEETYSRNNWTNLWDGESSFSGNDITLSSPWLHGHFDAGTKVSQNSEGGYMYPCQTINLQSNWISHSISIDEIDNQQIIDVPSYYGYGFRPGTAYIEIGFIINYYQVEDCTTWITNIRFEEIPDIDTSSLEINNKYIVETNVDNGIKIHQNKTDYTNYISIDDNKIDIINTNSGGVSIYAGSNPVAKFGEKVKIGGEKNYIELIPNPSSTEDSLSICANGKCVTLMSSEDNMYSSITGKHIEFSIGDLTQESYNIAVDSHTDGVLSVELLGSIKASGRVTSGQESTTIHLTNGASGDVYLHRKGDIVTLFLSGAKLGAGTVDRTVGNIPVGWRPPRQTSIPIDATSESLLFINWDGTINCKYNNTKQRKIWGRVTYIAWD